MKNKSLQHMRMALYAAGLTLRQVGRVSHLLRGLALQLRASVWPDLPLDRPTSPAGVQRSLLSYPEYRGLAQRARKGLRERERVSWQRARALGLAYTLHAARICGRAPTDPELQAWLQRWADELEPLFYRQEKAQ